MDWDSRRRRTSSFSWLFPGVRKDLRIWDCFNEGLLRQYTLDSKGNHEKLLSPCRASRWGRKSIVSAVNISMNYACPFEWSHCSTVAILRCSQQGSHRPLTDPRQAAAGRETSQASITSHKLPPRYVTPRAMGPFFLNSEYSLRSSTPRSGGLVRLPYSAIQRSSFAPVLASSTSVLITAAAPAAAMSC